MLKKHLKRDTNKQKKRDAAAAGQSGGGSQELEGVVVRVEVEKENHAAHLGTQERHLCGHGFKCVQYVCLCGCCAVLY